VDRFPSMRWPQLERILTREPLNYRLERHKGRRPKGGSHKKLVADGRPDLYMAFHDQAEIPGRTIRTILVDQVGLSEDEARALVTGRRKGAG
jgi:hypothetical protein